MMVASYGDRRAMVRATWQHVVTTRHVAVPRYSVQSKRDWRGDGLCHAKHRFHICYLTSLDPCPRH